MSGSYAAPVCSIEVYPFEGGSYSISGGQILECEVTKNVHTPVGTANIVLAPGGPNGQGFPSWAQIVTMQSLVIIAMKRGSRSNVIFVGVAQEVQEVQTWHPHDKVVRNTRIVAGDWGVWFQDFNWSSLSFLAVNGALEASAAGLPAQDGLPSILGASLQAVNPAQIASGWFDNLMGGASGILSQTNLQYKGNLIKWTNITQGHFENYPYQATFPVSVLYVANAGSWYSKFSEICDWPFYEILVGTAPANAWYSSGSPSGYTVSGTPFYSLGISDAVPATPGITCRLNRMPDLTTNISGQNVSYGASAYMDLWNGLPSHSMDAGTNFIESEASLSLEDYFNFFVLNPTNLKSWVFGTDSTNTPAVLFFTYAGAVNPAGIHRFGIRSMVKDTPWLSDPNFVARQATASGTGSGNFGDLISQLTTRMASYYTPTPLMEHASVSMPLRPDIFVGSKFTYYPFRQDQLWQFYVNTVTHRFVFGGPSMTELGLERGLPLTVYSNSTLMAAILTGNAQRFEGNIVSGLPAGQQNPLQSFGIQDLQGIQKVLGEIAAIYSSPGSK